MEWIALIAWLLTAVGGFVLLSIWVARDGMQQAREPGSRIRPGLILSHFALAATGLVLWIIYVATGSNALAWIAFVILLAVALLGWSMFAIWWRRRQRAALDQAVDPGTLTGKRKLFGAERNSIDIALLVGGDMHEHLGQLIAYARMNHIVPPWSK